MKIHCNREDLSRGVQAIQSALSARSTLPILINFLMETEDSKIKLSSTDLEVGVRHYLRAEVESGGSVTIPAKKFGDILHSLPDSEDVTIHADSDNKVQIRCGKSRFVVMGMPKSDYPVLPGFSKEQAFEVSAGLLQEMVRKVSFAVSADETRYVLNGIYCVAEKGTWMMVATDGRRLALVRRKGIPPQQQFKVIIPTKALQELIRLLSAFSEKTSKEARVLTSVSDNQVAFQIQETTLISRLIEGNFPNYEQVIPSKSDLSVEIPTQDLLAVTKRAALCTAERGGSVRYQLKKDSLGVSASTHGLWEFEDEIKVEYSGEPFEIAFNPGFLADMLKNVSSDKVSLNLTTPLNPGLLRPSNDADYLCVIMPMRIQP
ncbi:MAG: DNA polymerase III subunit beta [Elusimicrobia bacterium]|nr:DNA polymerase III subunit beta [Elusimicrobiota bacterium]